MARLTEEEFETIEMTNDHINEVYAAIAEAESGEFTAEAEMAAFLDRYCQ